MTPLLPQTATSYTQAREQLRAWELGDAMTHLVQGLHLSGISLTQAAAAFEKRYIECVLQECGGNKCKAARWLGMHRNTLERHITAHKIKYWEFNRPGRYAGRSKRKELYASKERAANLGGDHSRRSALAPVRTAQGPREVNAPEAGLPPASAAFTNSVRKGGRGESSEPSRGGAAHLALDRKPPCVESFDRGDVECGGRKA